MARALSITVAGCGPAGLAAALLLARRGHAVRMVERFQTPRPVGSGLLIQETGLAVLDRLGLAEALLSLGRPVHRLFGRSHPSGRVVLDIAFPTDPVRVLSVHRAALFGVLHGAVQAAGIPLDTGVVLSGLDRDASGRPVPVTADGRRLPATDLLVDALGARTPLHGAAAAPVVRRALAYGALWASLPVPTGFVHDPGALEQRYRQAREMAGILPVGRIGPDGEDQLTVFWSLRADQLAGLASGGFPAFVERVAALWPAAAGVVESLGSLDRLTFASYGHHTMPLPFGDRLAFIGDAAHATSPQLGQGANMALLDALALDTALAASPDDLAGALAGYARRRRRHVRLYQAMSTVFTPFYQSDGWMLPLLRDAFFSPVSRLPGMAGLLRALVGGTLSDPLAAIGRTAQA